MAAGDRYHGPYMSCGEEVGTGALINIKLDFKPIKIVLLNTTRLTRAEWNSAFPQDSAMLTVDSGAGTTDISYITSNAVSTGSGGFSIGTTASINTASDVIRWEAYRSYK